MTIHRNPPFCSGVARDNALAANVPPMVALKLQKFFDLTPGANNTFVILRDTPIRLLHVDIAALLDAIHHVPSPCNGRSRPWPVHSQSRRVTASFHRILKLTASDLKLPPPRDDCIVHWRRHVYIELAQSRQSIERLLTGHEAWHSNIDVDCKLVMLQKLGKHASRL